MILMLPLTSRTANLMSFTDWMPSWLRASLHDIRSVKPAAPVICPTDHFVTVADLSPTPGHEGDASR